MGVHEDPGKQVILQTTPRYVFVMVFWGQIKLQSSKSEYETDTKEDDRF